MTHRPVTISPPPPNDVPQVEPLLLAVGDVARLLNVSRLTVFRWRSAGRLPLPVKIGRVVRWRRSEIETWIAQGCPNSRGPARR